MRIGHADSYAGKPGSAGEAMGRVLPGPQGEIHVLRIARLHQLWTTSLCDGWLG
jgi:hypothetical protein